MRLVAQSEPSQAAFSFCDRFLKSIFIHDYYWIESSSIQKSVLSKKPMQSQDVFHIGQPTIFNGQNSTEFAISISFTTLCLNQILHASYELCIFRHQWHDGVIHQFIVKFALFVCLCPMHEILALTNFIGYCLAADNGKLVERRGRKATGLREIS